MRSTERFPFAALLCGAVGIGFAPIFVRLSELGPSATAFYRLFFALPLLWLWMGWERRPRQPQSEPRVSENVCSRWFFVVAGLSFAADIALWHWSIKLTTVANATLLANFTPLFVTAGARFFFRERITFPLLAGIVLALVGGAMLVQASFHVTSRHVWGDAVALMAAVFYAGYLLAVKQLTQSFSTSTIMAWCGLVTSLALLAVTLLSRESLVATHATAWILLVALALISQVVGQGFITYALAHLPASFSSVSLFLQPVVATALAWILLSEPLSGLQILGGCAVLSGIVIASRWKRG
jgi:drug/metabolite transporter (DMT)-like permease